MIKLEKSEVPAVLRKNSSSWTKAVVEKTRRGEIPSKTEKSRYNHPEIKSALISETHGKCAYCESKIRHIDHGDIEHVVPKSIVPELWFDWGNLTLACSVCNQKKSITPGDHTTFVDPYRCDPNSEFWIMGAMVLPRPGCQAALATEQLLQLNRAELVERRTERLRNLLNHLAVIENTTDETIKQILFEDFREETSSTKEYAALAREVYERATREL